MFWNGSTAMDGLSGSARAGPESEEYFPIVGVWTSPKRIRHARIGSAMFFRVCEPISSKAIADLAANLPIGVIGYADPARLLQCLQGGQQR